LLDLLTVVTLVVLSVFLRIQNKKRVESHKLPEHSKPSLFSEALQELIATAGGIYLSLVLLVTFLQINLADKWQIYEVKMDPLAFIALSLALIQPLALRFYRLLKGDR
jgi:uncharacterized membrane protein